MTRRAAVYVRVSTEEQSVENQLARIREFADARGFIVVSVYQEEESAWKGGRQRELARLMRDARLGRFTVVLVWALDRISREGALAILTKVNTLGGYGVDLISLQESWTEFPSEVKPLLFAFMGWVAQMESKRISERTKAGLERARASGKRIGRPAGSKDSKPRAPRQRKPVWG